MKIDSISYQKVKLTVVFAFFIIGFFVLTSFNQNVDYFAFKAENVILGVSLLFSSLVYWYFMLSDSELSEMEWNVFIFSCIPILSMAVMVLFLTAGVIGLLQLADKNIKKRIVE